MKTQYFSKWRKEWIDFKDAAGNLRNPNEGELQELKKYYYQIRIIKI